MQTGIVNSIWTKSVKTRNGPADVNLFTLDGVEDMTFNLGFGKCPVKVGDEINFNYDGPKYGEYQVDKATLKIESRDNPVSTPPPPPAEPKPESKPSGGGKSGGYSRGNFPLDFNDGQRSILRQHAFTQASEIAREEVRAADAGIEDDELFVDHVIKLAYKIERYTSGDDLRDEMKDGE